MNGGNSELEKRFSEALAGWRRLWSGVGATGAVSAVRRELFRPIPRGTILDDVYWPMQVALQGRRVVHDDRAHAFDRLPNRTRDEFRRKVRTLEVTFHVGEAAQRGDHQRSGARAGLSPRLGR